MVSRSFSRERAVAAGAAGESRRALSSLAGGEHLHPAVELVANRLAKRHRPLLVRGQAIAAQAFLRKGCDGLRKLNRRRERLSFVHQSIGKTKRQRLFAR